MTSTLYAEAARVFLELLELAPEDRSRALAARESLDPCVQTEVESLLAHHRDDAFPSRAALSETGANAERALPKRIGDYEVERFLGAGGMATVYEVRQGAVGRSAALKVLHELLVDDVARERFRLEIEALARLNHPGIAQIYDAGIDTSGVSLPFFVMELVRGVPLDAWARIQGRSTAEILAKFLDVCDAIEHAHQRGIVHRDLKPDNVLVDGDGRVKVLDFGIARPVASHQSLSPVTGDARMLVGTLEFMSPEQCSLEPVEIDVRTDIYSLGALLYALLTGAPPIQLDGLGLIQAVHQVCDATISAPRRNGRPLARDLEAIVLEALAKERRDRYQSVSSLAEDLRRFIAGLPVHARAPSLAARSFALARRHPIAVAVLTSLSLAAIILGSSSYAAWRFSARPDRLRVDPESAGVRLVSQGERELHHWSGLAGDTHLMSYSERALGGQLGLIAFHDGRRVVAFDAHEPENQLWSTRDLPATPPGPVPSQMALPRCEVLEAFDLLPEEPGLEILAIEILAPHSPSVIRILDKRGTVRFEVWHDGHIRGVSWFPAARRLVCVGYNSSVTWPERGVDLLGEYWPAVVFALDVRDGHVNRDEYLITEDTRDASLAWYRWVGPIETLRKHTLAQLRLTNSAARAGKPVTLLRLATKRFAASIVENVQVALDADGNEVDRIIGDGYRAAFARGEVPSPDDWRLLPFEDLPIPVR